MMKRLIPALLSAAALVYTLWYMHFDKPWTNDGALSTIGLTHHTYFVLWGLLTFAALAVPLITAYRRYLKTKIYIPLIVVAAIGMAFTLIFDFDYDINPYYYFHCAGSLVFSVVTGTAVFLLFLLCYKKDILFKIFTYLSAGVLIGDLICLIIFQETGLIEVVPIFTGYIMLAVTNMRREKIEITR